MQCHLEFILLFVESFATSNSLCSSLVPSFTSHGHGLSISVVDLNQCLVNADQLLTSGPCEGACLCQNNICTSCKSASKLFPDPPPLAPSSGLVERARTFPLTDSQTATLDNARRSDEAAPPS